MYGSFWTSFIHKTFVDKPLKFRLRLMIWFRSSFRKCSILDANSLLKEARKEKFNLINNVPKISWYWIGTQIVVNLKIDFLSHGFPLLDEEYTVQFLFENELMLVQTDFEVVADIRRLSTEPSINNPVNPLAAVWTWYWKDENGMWLAYGSDYLVRFYVRYHFWITITNMF